jgi:phosphoribosylformylglycinamidine synthase
LLVGARQDECGGSTFYQLYDTLGANLPKPNLKTIAKELQAITQVITQGFALSVHDISDGGIAVAIAEMSFKNKIGVTITIEDDLPLAKKLFSETGGFVLEVSDKCLPEVHQLFSKFNIPIITLGMTQSEPMLVMNNIINIAIDDALQAWKNGLREKLQ